MTVAAEAAVEVTVSYVASEADFDALVRESWAEVPRIDPRDVALVLFEESGFNPAAVNHRAGMYGANQMSAANLDSLHITPDNWIARPLATQLPAIFGFWRALAKSFDGGLFAPDAAHLLALNFLPGRYRDRGAQTNEDAPLAQNGVADYHHKDGSPGYFYADNATLDPRHTGAITVATIRDRLRDVAEQGGMHWESIYQGTYAAMERAGMPEPGAPPPPLPPRPPPRPPPAPPPPPVAARWPIAIVVLGVALVVGAVAVGDR